MKGSQGTQEAHVGGRRELQDPALPGTSSYSSRAIRSGPSTLRSSSKRLEKPAPVNAESVLS